MGERRRQRDGGRGGRRPRGHAGRDALAKLERGLLAGFFYPEDLYCTVLSKQLKLSLSVDKLAEQLRGPWDLGPGDDSEPRELTV